MVPHIVERVSSPLLDDLDAEELGNMYWTHTRLLEEVVRL